MLLLAGHASRAAHFVTPQELAATAAHRVHLGTKARSCEDIEADLNTVGRNIGTAAAMVKSLYGEGGKVFHQHSIGSTFVQFDLSPDRPDFIRHGMFSNEMPNRSFGFANFTTGRSTPAPPHLKPDVTGLTVVLDMNGFPVVLTTTAAPGAFADTAVQFSELAWFPALMTAFLGGWSKDELMATRDSDWKWNQSKAEGVRGRLAALVGELLGESIFFARNIKAAASALLPAIFSGRRSPFLGYSGWFGLGENTGFGSGHPYLLNSVPPSELENGVKAGQERRAFRYGFRLVSEPDDPHSHTEDLKRNVPGFARTLARAYWDRHYLSAEFRKWNFGPVKYELYLQLEDLSNPYKTPLDVNHRAWKSEKIPVATLTLLPAQGGSPEVLERLVREFPANPGLGFHRPVGALGFDRAVGPLVKRDAAAANGSVVGGAYVLSQERRGALAVDNGRIDLEKLQDRLRQMKEEMWRMGYFNKDAGSPQSAAEGSKP